MKLVRDGDHPSTLLHFPLRPMVCVFKFLISSLNVRIKVNQDFDFTYMVANDKLGS